MNRATKGLLAARRYLFGDNFGQAFGAVTLVVTNAQAKAFRATPLTVVAAQGVGKLIVPMSLQVALVYGGTNAFVQGGAGENFSLKYKDGTTTSLILAGIGAFVQATTSGIAFGLPGAAIGAAMSVTKANGDNQALVLHNPAAAELTGNAAADNTFVVTVTYLIQPSQV